MVAASVACGSETDGGEQASSDLTSLRAPAEWDRAVTRPPADDVASASRGACTFGRGSMPAETLGSELPVGDDIPVKTVVVLMQENRSFDSYFGHLGAFMHRSDIDGAPEDTSVPEDVTKPDGPRQKWHRRAQLCFADTNHEWDGSHLEWNGGKMDGFFQANHGWSEHETNPADPLLHGSRAMQWYGPNDIPFYYELASTFAVGDRYFASVMGPTFPNRDYLYAATSLGEKDDGFPNISQWSFPAKDLVVFDMLERRGISWGIFVDGGLEARVGSMLGTSFLTRWGIGSGKIRSRSALSDLAASGRLPQVVFVDANIKEDSEGTDEHPPSNIQRGEEWVSDVLHELLASPQWREMAIFFSYDENGGIYDHVPPPKACVADALSKDFDRYGFRVPFLVISPFAKKSFVSHGVYDHTSILRFIEAKFRLPALTGRDANALPPYDMFDFKNPPFTRPPALRHARDIPPEGGVASRDTRDAQCQSLFGGQSP
jgi:phospholipase C